MKIEINLLEIMHEDGETVKEAIYRQVTEQLLEWTKKDVAEQVKSCINREVGKIVAAAVAEETPKLVQGVLDAEFTPTSQWGYKSEPTTFRKELLKSFTEQMVYKVDDCGRVTNTYSRAVKEIIDGQVATFKKEFNSLI